MSCRVARKVGHLAVTHVVRKVGLLDMECEGEAGWHGMASQHEAEGI